MRQAVAGRVTGGVYLLYFVASLAGGFLTPGVTAPGALDAAAIHGQVYQLGVALGLVSTGLYLAVVGLLYRLFSPLRPRAGVLALLFGLTGCVLMALGSACRLAAPAATPELAAAFLALNVECAHVALVFFGTFQLFLGYMIYSSTFVPRVIGALIATAGLGWLTFLAPEVPTPLFIPVAVLGGLSEVSLMLWLLIAGVDDTRSLDQLPARTSP